MGVHHVGTDDQEEIDAIERNLGYADNELDYVSKKNKTKQKPKETSNYNPIKWPPNTVSYQ